MQKEKHLGTHSKKRGCFILLFIFFLEIEQGDTLKFMILP